MGCRRRLFACLALALCAVEGAVGSLIVMAPEEATGGTPKLLVLINGAGIGNEHYRATAAAIMTSAASCNVSLWVAIPSFLLDTPNPAELHGKVTEAIAAVGSRGFGGINASADVFVGGHSLGGIFAQHEVATHAYAGLILLGSYLTTAYGYDVETFGTPTLTVGGEVDGLTRVTYLAAQLEGLEARVAREGDVATFEYAVALAPGVSHSQFASGVNVTSFGVKRK